MPGPSAWSRAAQIRHGAPPRTSKRWSTGMRPGHRLAFLFLILHPLHTSCKDPKDADEFDTTKLPLKLEIKYSGALQPYVHLVVGGQPVKLIFDTSTAPIAVAIDSEDSSSESSGKSRYSWRQSIKIGTLEVCSSTCYEACEPAVVLRGDWNNVAAWCQPKAWNENVFKTNMDSSECFHTAGDMVTANGQAYNESYLEVNEKVDIFLDEGFTANGTAVRLIRPLGRPQHSGSLKLFEDIDGLFGVADGHQTCRMQSYWYGLLEKTQARAISFNFAPPEASRFFRKGVASYVVLERHARNLTTFDKLEWSQSAWASSLAYEMLMYKFSVCGVDLLYNTSSNWLAMLATNSPCLVLPPFLFDRLMAHLPAVARECPFRPGEPAKGRLCPVRRDGDHNLPSLSFRVNDTQGADDRGAHVYLPLERLVVNQDGEELLCVAKSDVDRFELGDMQMARIRIGSLAMSAMNVAWDRRSGSIGLATKDANVSEVSSDHYCASRVTCLPMQVYYPPSNQCLDPDCSLYFFTELDDQTKTCVWAPHVLQLFVGVIIVLVILEVVTHMLYKNTMRKASEMHS